MHLENYQMCLIAISIAVGLATLAIFYPKKEEVKEMSIDQYEQSLRIKKLQLQIKKLQNGN